MDWKKEYRMSDLFRRGAKEEGSQPVPASEPPREVAEPPSVWKKELRVSGVFRRSPKDEQVAQPVPEQPQAEPVEDSVAAAQPEHVEPQASEPEPVEPEPVAELEQAAAPEPVAFEPPPAESVAPEPAQELEPVEEPVAELGEEPEPQPAPEAATEAPAEPSVWKKEIRVSGVFRRSKKEEPQASEPEPVEPEPVAELEQAAAPEPVAFEPPPAESVAPEPAQELEPVEEPVAELGEEPEPQPAPEAATEAPAEPSVWKKEIRVSGVFRRSKKEEPQASEPEPVEPEPVAELEQAAAPEPVAFEPPPAESVAPEPAQELEPVEEPVAELGEEPEPQPAPEAATEAPAEPSVWKKEIRVSGVFRRSKKEEPQASEPEPVEPEPVAELEQAAAPEPVPQSEPFEEPVAQAPAAPDQPPAEAGATSAWKKEIRIGRQREPKQRKPRGRGKQERRDEAPRRDRPTEGRVARSEARGAKAAGQLPDVPLVRALNLLPREEAKTRRVRPSLPQVGVALLGLIVLGGLSFAFIHERSRVESRRGDVENLEAQVALIQTPASADQPQEGVQLAGELLARAGTLSTALDSRIVWDRLLRELSLVLPPGVWFETVTSTPVASAPDPATGLTPPPSGAALLTIAGYSKTQEGLAQLLARLTVLPQLASVQLQSGTLVERGGEEVVQFSVAAVLEPDGGAAS